MRMRQRTSNVCRTWAVDYCHDRSHSIILIFFNIDTTGPHCAIKRPPPFLTTSCVLYCAFALSCSIIKGRIVVATTL